MDPKQLTFNDIPAALQDIMERLDRIETMLQNLSDSKETQKPWMNIEQLSEYLPSHPAKQTIYNWVYLNSIPYYKKGKVVYFKRQDIDKWLDQEGNL